MEELKRKWRASRNGPTLARNNQAKHNNSHEQIEKNITISQVIMAFDACLNDDSRLKFRLINSANLLLIFACAMAHCTRSESYRMECLVCDFSKDFPRIGSKGHVAICSFSNGGKNSASGELDCNGSIAHLSPVQSADSLKGISFLFCCGMLGEVFPDFSQHENHFSVPAL